MSCPTYDLTGLIASAFLDVHGQFAKSHESVHTVALWFDDASPPRRVDLTVDEFDSLTEAQKDQIRETGSGAAYL